MNILISGGSGSLGQALSRLLSEKGHKVSWLSRSQGKQKYNAYYWNPDKQEIDMEAVRNNELVIHLAGAGVADKRWSESYKNEIMNSRVQGTRLLVNTINNMPGHIHTFISASASGFYGNSGDQLVTESSAAGNTFLAKVCQNWEAESELLDKSVRRVIVRIGIVLEKSHGALAEMAKPVKLFAGAPLGPGSQYIPWIHIDDLCGIFAFVTENFECEGIYNAVAPDSVTNAELTRYIAKALGRPLFLPNIPAFVLQLVVGPMTETLVNGNNVSAGKILKSGYRFKYQDANEAVHTLLAVN